MREQHRQAAAVLAAGFLAERFAEGGAVLWLAFYIDRSADSRRVQELAALEGKSLHGRMRFVLRAEQRAARVLGTRRAWGTVEAVADALLEQQTPDADGLNVLLTTPHQPRGFCRNHQVVVDPLSVVRRAMSTRARGRRGADEGLMGRKIV